MQRGSKNKAIFQAKNKRIPITVDLIDDVLDQEIDAHEERAGLGDLPEEFEKGFIAGLQQAKHTLNQALQINE